jgi:hypothetical protein
MRHLTPQVLSVTDAATMLAPRTIRRWLHEGYLVGQKIGTSWVVFCPAERACSQTRPGEAVSPQNRQRNPALLRQRLRQLGTRLITIGNAMADAHCTRGEVFLTWRRPGRLQITFAIGRISPTRGWAPHALGIELPFWLKERQRWQRVRPLLRQYEQLRNWCDPRLLRLPQVQAVVEAELHRLPHCPRGMRNIGTPRGGASNTVHEQCMSQEGGRSCGSQPTTSILCARYAAES